MGQHPSPTTHTEDLVFKASLVAFVRTSGIPDPPEHPSSGYTNTTTPSPSLTQNVTIPPGCIEFRFDQVGYLPWDNLDNIVSAEVEEATRRVKDAILVPLLFLIGGPANVINMAVFWKQGLRERINLCLFALSLADELYLIQTIFLYGEQLPLQFTTGERYGPFMRFIVNNNLVGFFGFTWTSQVLSAIIASERCLCVLRPLQFQTLLRTKTTAVIIVAVFVLVIGPYFLVAARYRISCMHDPALGLTLDTFIAGEFYLAHATLINYLDSFVYGAGIPVFAMVVVMTTTTLTAVKLRQILAWRAKSTSTSTTTTTTTTTTATTTTTTTSSGISAREVGLTRMLVGSSVLFIICVSPIALFRFVWLFLPEVNSGGRQQNFFLTSLWILEAVSYVNSSFNIAVYYSMGSYYRRTFWALLGRAGGKRGVGGSHRKGPGV